MCTAATCQYVLSFCLLLCGDVGFFFNMPKHQHLFWLNCKSIIRYQARARCQRMGWINFLLEKVVPFRLSSVCVLVSDPLTTKSACLEWEKAQQSQVSFLLGSGAELASWEMSQVPEPAQRGGEGRAAWVHLWGRREQQHRVSSNKVWSKGGLLGSSWSSSGAVSVFYSSCDEHCACWPRKTCNRWLWTDSILVLNFMCTFLCSLICGMSVCVHLSIYLYT